MATPWGPSDNPLLSGLFGVLQSASAARTDTAGTWAALRRAAGTWQWQSRGLGDLPDDATLEANGAEVLRSQGVGIQEVNTYRQIANQWRTAHENLGKAGTGDQIRGNQIFTPPWAQTVGSTLPSRYRVRVNWEITPVNEEPMNVWASYEIDSPLTTLDDVLQQAGQLASTKPGSPFKGKQFGLQAVDYSLEQI